MEQRFPHFVERNKLTKLSESLAQRLERTELPLITPYALFREIRELYRSGKKLYLRKPTPERADFARTRDLLVAADILAPDRDYGSRAYRILANSDRPADEVCCVVDRFCYISHLSAMERYGLTDRRPTALHLTAPHERIITRLTRQAMIEDYGHDALESLDPNQLLPLHGVSHPETVRRRKIDVFRTSHLGENLQVRGTFARIATIGNTFIDMLEHPGECGGMNHVLDIWREHAGLYLDDIIDAVDRHPRSIIKVRAGYIFDELLGIRDTRIDGWRCYAQRGGSRVLDPSRPFAPTYSETWMLSLNAP